MFEGFDPSDVVACALRPTGSAAHLASLVAFVMATAFTLRGPRDDRSGRRRRSRAATRIL